MQEIQKGAVKLRLDSDNKSKKATALSNWLDSLIEKFDDKILPVDAAVARVAGVVEATATAKGRNPGFADVLIASTAKAYDLVLLTANMKHFEPLDIELEKSVRIIFRRLSVHFISLAGMRDKNG